MNALLASPVPSKLEEFLFIAIEVKEGTEAPSDRIILSLTEGSPLVLPTSKYTHLSSEPTANT